jgi:hypothetical protein
MQAVAMASRPRVNKSRKPHVRLNVGKKAYGWSLDAAKVAGIFSVIFGVVFGIVQYNQARNDKRVEQSLQLFRQFNNPPYTDYRKRINVAVIDNRLKITDAVTDEARLTAAVTDMVRKEKIETDLAFVLSFFDTVAYCAAQDICNSQIILDLFYPSAWELYVPFYQYIRIQQSAFNEFGAGVLTLVDLKKQSARAQTQANVGAK